MAERGFVSTFGPMTAPFLVWAAHFGIVYGINGLACARGLDQVLVLGLPLVTAAILGASAAAVLAAGGLLARSLGGAVAGDFVRWFTAVASGAALLAILWVALPVLQVPACG